jgi:hypothetical protein
MAKPKGSRKMNWWRRIMAAIGVGLETSPIAGMPLRYMLGADEPIAGEDGCVVMVPYRARRARAGLSAGYCNAFDETQGYNPKTNTGFFGPYRPKTDTARDYSEGVPDQDGPGYKENIVTQLDLRGAQGINIVEIDNPDAYPVAAVLEAIDWARERGIAVLAKNPGLVNRWRDDFLPVVAHPNVVGMIVEHGAGDAHGMHNLREAAGRPRLPVRFVAYNDDDGGEQWANGVAHQIERERYRDMGVTYSPGSQEYATSRDVIRPNTWSE